VTRPDVVASDPVTRPDPVVERCETLSSTTDW